MSSIYQEGILAEIPPLARHLFFSLKHEADPRSSLMALSERVDGTTVVCGIGAPIAYALEKPIAGLRPFPQYTGHGIPIPSTPMGLWCWLRGTDRGELLHRSRALQAALHEDFQLDYALDAFRYAQGKDLTGYEDGTENPKADKAVRVATLPEAAGAMRGSSFVAVQKWRHDLDHFESMTRDAQDYTIGRDKLNNEELTDAPAYAHVKRTAQESFDPEAFILRRSMPWADQRRCGLVFVAFATSFDAFESQLRRMIGLDDGIVDGLFRFTRPITGAYFWCPGMADGRLNLQALGL